MAKSENKTDKKTTAKAAPKNSVAVAKPAKPADAKKPVATKTTASKKPAVSKQSAKQQNPSAEERYRMTEVAAYFMAERNHFAGSPVEYWQAAEAQINKLLGQK